MDDRFPRMGVLGRLLSRALHRLQLVPLAIRRFVRSREIGLSIFAGVIGVLAAALVALMSALASIAHAALFGLQPGVHLSVLTHFDNPLVPMAGGIVLGAITLLSASLGRIRIVDPIEANALHGGRMSFRDSALLTLQTVVSNGSGASVGLEAGYTQISSGLASRMGAWMRLRRDDMRILVGCGAAGAIAATFNGPLTGAFYAFELILAQYAIGYVAPVMTASIAATLAMHALGGAPFALEIGATRAVTAWDFPWFLALGALCAGVGIAWMRALPLVERIFEGTGAPRITHPAIGGLVVGLLAVVSPQVLAAGHGALELGLFGRLSVYALLAVAGLKIAASSISIGAGFRGGMFFSSLLVGALLGRACAIAITTEWPQTALDITAFSLVGMGALAAVVIGTPLTMSFLVLETTSDYGLTGAVLAAAVTGNLIARETFGYSFSTWRFHLRGETLRSAHDVGRLRELTVGRLMRTSPPLAQPDISVGEFQAAFPLGAHQRVALIDAEGRFKGLVVVAELHAEGLADDMRVGQLAHDLHPVLTPSMTIQQAMTAFDESESDTLAVVDDPKSRRLLGTLKESYAVRRYAEELEHAQRLTT